MQILTTPLSPNLALLGALLGLLALTFLVLLCQWAYRRERARAVLWQLDVRGLEAVGVRRRLVVIHPPEPEDVAIDTPTGQG